MAPPKALILMADYGHDPTETAVPFSAFKESGFDVHFATEKGNVPKCDDRMLYGLTGKLLGANRSASKLYHEMTADAAMQKPHAWTEPSFSLEPFDVLFLPGGHDKGMRQIIDSEALHKLLAAYFPMTRKPGKKTVAAVCHGVMALAAASLPDGKSILHDVDTTTLPGTFEGTAFWGTRLFLGDYYKTYGKDSESIEMSVKKRLDDPAKQFSCSLGLAPFVVEDKNYNYVSARFPPDAGLLAENTIALVEKALQS